MAIQILQSGKEPEGPAPSPRVGKCGYCGCVFRVDPESIRWVGAFPIAYCPAVLKKRRWWFDEKCGHTVTLYREESAPWTIPTSTKP